MWRVLSVSHEGVTPGAAPPHTARGSMHIARCGTVCRLPSTQSAPTVALTRCRRRHLSQNSLPGCALCAVRAWVCARLLTSGMASPFLSPSRLHRARMSQHFSPGPPQPGMCALPYTDSPTGGKRVLLTAAGRAEQHHCAHEQVIWSTRHIHGGLVSGSWQGGQPRECVNTIPKPQVS